MPTKSAWVERILRVLDHIQAHLDEELEPRELAVLAEFSVHHFHRVFRGMTGESVMGLIRRLRLERAAMRLKFGEASVTEVAALSGYGSHEAFTRAFRARFEVAPSGFRDTQETASLGEHKLIQHVWKSRTILCTRHVGPYEECLRAWERLRSWAEPAGLWGTAEQSVGLCYDDPDITASERLRYDAGLVVPEQLASQFALPPDIVVRTLPGGAYEGIEHRGPYEEIFDAYVALLGHYLPRRGAELADEPVVEIYLTSPYEVEPADLRTQICVRLDE